MYRTVCTEVEVDVNLSDFDTQDLIDELDSRGEWLLDCGDNATELVRSIWLKRRVGRTDYQEELDQLIYHVIGRAV
jgi:hypothetical protein